MGRRRRWHPNWPYIAAWVLILLGGGLFVLWRILTAHNYHLSDGIHWKMAWISGAIDGVVGAWFMATGASIGSFINVVAYRVPRGISIVGPSRCPFCTTQLSPWDNFPILGWLRLRSRCRTCRLPIAFRYFAVELLTMSVFAAIFFTEFLTDGANLPSRPDRMRLTLESRLFNSPYGLQIFLYLWVISGLVTSALIAWQRSPAPLRIFFWQLLPCFAIPLVVPAVIEIPWRHQYFKSVLEQRLDACLTVLFGIAAGIICARLTAANLYGRFDLKLIRQDQPTQQTIQWMGSLAVAGALLGWQAMTVIALLTGVIARLAKWTLGRRIDAQTMGNWVGWIWLATLLYRTNWNALSRVPEWVPIQLGNPILIAHLMIGLMVLALSWVSRVSK